MRARKDRPRCTDPEGMFGLVTDFTPHSGTKQTPATHQKQNTRQTHHLFIGPGAGIHNTTPMHYLTNTCTHANMHNHHFKTMIHEWLKIAHSPACKSHEHDPQLRHDMTHTCFITTSKGTTFQRHMHYHDNTLHRHANIDAYNDSPTMKFTTCHD